MSNYIVSVRVILSSLFLVHTNGLLDRTQDNWIEARFQTLSQEFKQLQQNFALLQSQLNSQNAKQTGPVAFTAALSSTITNMGTHQQIVFENVLTNSGNGYNKLDGHFTAPIRGVYVFFVTLTNVPEHSSSTDLMKNGQWIAHALVHSNSKDGGLVKTSTIAVTVQMEQGDRVWVQHGGVAYSAVEELNGAKWSMFSGHLVGAN